MSQKILDIKFTLLVQIGVENDVGIVVDKDLKDDVVTVSRKGDRIILVKLILGGNTINIINVYAQQVGLDQRIKTQFWENMDELM